MCIRRIPLPTGPGPTVPDVFSYLELEGDGSHLTRFVDGLRSALGDRARVLAGMEDLAGPTPRWVRLNIDVLGADELATVETVRAAINEADIDRGLICGPAFLTAT